MIVLNLMFHKEEEEFFFMAVRDDIMDKVGLNFMTLSSLFPTPNKTITTLEGAFDGLEYDKEEVAMLTEKWKETNILQTNMCIDAS